MNILFVCRGNAFRSIIAETILSSKQFPNVTVFSAGTCAQQYYTENYSIFLNITQLLKKHGMGGFVKKHYGDTLTQKMLDDADVVVALNEIVFQEIKKKGFRTKVAIHTWNIADSNETHNPPRNQAELLRYHEKIFFEIQQNIDELCTSLNLL